MSHPSDTVCAVWQLGTAAGHLLVQLPVLAVLVTGLVLVSRRRARIGSRRAGLALAGLATLALGVMLATLWSVLLPTLITEFDLSPTQMGTSFGRRSWWT